MKKTNQEIDYVEAILALRTMLSISKCERESRKLENSEFVHLEIVDLNSFEKGTLRQI
jgi:hypothetical protein